MCLCGLKAGFRLSTLKCSNAPKKRLSYINLFESKITKILQRRKKTEQFRDYLNCSVRFDDVNGLDTSLTIGFIKSYATPFLLRVLRYQLIHLAQSSRPVHYVFPRHSISLSLNNQMSLSN